MTLNIIDLTGRIFIHFKRVISLHVKFQPVVFRAYVSPFLPVKLPELCIYALAARA
jgi:hypothetical protein